MMVGDRLVSTILPNPFTQNALGHPVVEGLRLREQPWVKIGPDENKRQKQKSAPPEPHTASYRERKQWQDRESGPAAPGVRMASPGGIVHAHGPFSHTVDIRS